MALPCHVNSSCTIRAVPTILSLCSSPSLLQVQHHWRCSSFLKAMHTPKSEILVTSSVVVEALAGGHIAEKVSQLPISRRDVGVSAMTLLCMATLFIQHPYSAEARQRRNTKAIPIEDYKTSSDGIKYYDLKEGKGLEAKKGSTVLVHFDCIYRGLTVASSRESKLLAGNRAIAQPYEFTVGAPPGKERKRDFVDNPNGLFSAQAAPKPPPALYTLIEGMHVGGQRTVIVTPEVGYGKRSMNEIPPNGTFDLNVELLEASMMTASSWSKISRRINSNRVEIGLEEPAKTNNSFSIGGPVTSINKLVNFYLSGTQS